MCAFIFVIKNIERILLLFGIIYIKYLTSVQVVEVLHIETTSNYHRIPIKATIVNNDDPTSEYAPNFTNNEPIRDIILPIFKFGL